MKEEFNRPKVIDALRRMFGGSKSKEEQEKIDATMAQTDTKNPKTIKNDAERAAFDQSIRGVRHSPGRPRLRRRGR